MCRSQQLSQQIVLDDSNRQLFRYARFIYRIITLRFWTVIFNIANVFEKFACNSYYSLHFKNILIIKLLFKTRLLLTNLADLVSFFFLSSNLPTPHRVCAIYLSIKIMLWWVYTRDCSLHIYHTQMAVVRYVCTSITRCVASTNPLTRT